VCFAGGTPQPIWIQQPAMPAATQTSKNTSGFLGECFPISFSFQFNFPRSRQKITKKLFLVENNLMQDCYRFVTAAIFFCDFCAISRRKHHNRQPNLALSVSAASVKRICCRSTYVHVSGEESSK
jgi:hypothetical protein